MTDDDLIRRGDVLRLLQSGAGLTLTSQARRIAALPAVQPVVKVKPLVWFEASRGNNGWGVWTAEGYRVRKIEGVFLLDFSGDGRSDWRYSTADAAKAAAQADYEARILAALDLS